MERLFRVIATLRGEGVGIIYISHRLEEIAAIADRVTVLRDGQTDRHARMEEVDRAELIRLMVGREISRDLSQARGADRATSCWRCAGSDAARRESAM